MHEIEQIPWNGLTVASTFSGCGGSSLGYRMAGFRVLWANEFIPLARDTYLLNASPSTIVDPRDIRQIQPADVLDAMGLAPGELDLFDGSPPCASFSMSGSRARGWGQTKKYSNTQQRTDDLFHEYIRLLRGIQPRSFVAENVTGLVVGKAKGHFLRILAAMREAGYTVEARVLDSQWLGVPQARQRLIFVGVRTDLNLAPAFPNPLPHRYTLRDAIGEDALNPGSVRVYVRRPPDERDDVALAESTEHARAWRRTPRGAASTKYINLKREHPDEPVSTVVACGGTGASSVTHPNEPRKFTIHELRRICGFPDDFRLRGSYAQRWERLGRAVPPVMMCHIASAVRDGVLLRQRVDA